MASTDAPDREIFVVDDDPGASAPTPREREMLAQIVAIHHAHIMQKLGAKNSVDLMRIVVRKTDDETPRG